VIFELFDGWWDGLEQQQQQKKGIYTQMLVGQRYSIVISTYES
jgi:hypothetical protein